MSRNTKKEETGGCGIMKYDIICCGVGGQGVLSVAALIAHASMREGLSVRQSEVHGMAQRGGAVMSHLRIADHPVASDLIAKGTAHMILSMEPLEGLRYLDFLAPEGVLVTASEPFINIPNYPDLEALHGAVRSVKGYRLVDTQRLAKEAGLIKATNIVLTGAASVYLPLAEETLKNSIRELFGKKGSQVVDANLSAFSLGKN